MKKVLITLTYGLVLLLCAALVGLGIRVGTLPATTGNTVRGSSEFLGGFMGAWTGVVLAALITMRVGGKLRGERPAAPILSRHAWDYAPLCAEAAHE